MFWHRLIGWSWLLVVGSAVYAQEQFSRESLDYFESRVRPLLVDNCFTCHSANTNSKGGLRVDDRNGLLSGGEHGPAVVPGKPDESLLLQAVAHTHSELRMPPGKQLSDEQIADLAQWILDGAAWPEPESEYYVEADSPEYEALRNTHWAWQRLSGSPPPSVAAGDWPHTNVDRFILARLEREGLRPVEDADRRTLIRRLSFDLTGLPPTWAEVAEFVADDSPDAYERLVDRLLASPAYGEHWGRHWLDVARYGESTGSSRNLPYPHAWRYRDYVIDAFTNDLPYDQFVREQVAGDLLPATDQQQQDRQQIATGFLALGVKDVNQRFKVRFVMDNIDEQIDTVTRSFLALTVSCARCHDHKFDPVPTRDYYALAGIFASSDLCAGVRNKMGGGGLDYYDADMLLQLGAAGEIPEPDAETAAKIAELKQAVKQARAEFQALRGKPEGNELDPEGRPKRAVARQKMNRLNLELRALSDPVALAGRAAFGVREARQIADTQIRIRGEAEQLGATVPRGFLSVLSQVDTEEIPPNQSGRLQLANWLVSENNPLTSRVMVNRVWHHLFGSGLVPSVDNFGINGDVPSHPELLDFLASEFVADGWSVKRLVRSLVLSRTYRLSSNVAEEGLEADPANRLQWRHSPRRLTAEELRDATLLASGNLQPMRANASPASKLQVIELRNNGPEALKLQEQAAQSTLRSIYLPLLRGITPRSLEVFDFADQGMVTGSRDATTVATQALYLLNDPFVIRHSHVVAEHLLSEVAPDDTSRVRVAYQRLLGREPSPLEVELAREFVQEYLAIQAQLAEASLVVAVAESPAISQQATSDADQAGTNSIAQPQNPDEVDQSDAPDAEPSIAFADAATEAWASFCQALFASAEFRYLQ